jgi:hypothetical protein
MSDTFHFHGDAEVISFEMGKQVQNKVQINNGEPEEEFSQGPLTDNIIDMSMRNASESDDELEVAQEQEQEQEQPSNQPPLTSIKLQEDPEESDTESVAESDADSVISDASSNDSEPLPPIKIGMAIDSSSSDGSIPPPPPPLDENTEELK